MLTHHAVPFIWRSIARLESRNRLFQARLGNQPAEPATLSKVTLPAAFAGRLLFTYDHTPLWVGEPAYHYHLGSRRKIEVFK